MTAGVGWTQDDMEQAAQMWSEGVPASSIARRLGKTRNAVLGKIGRMGLSRKHQPAALRKTTAASHPGQRQTAQARGRIRRPWTPVDDARLRQLWSEGYATDEIATRLGRTEAEIVGRAGRLELLDPEPSERYSDPEWFVRCNARFCRAMNHALRKGLVTLPVDVDER